jgi:hypothetical protein
MNEFRTSMLHNKLEKECKNDVREFNIKKLSMKSIYNLMKLKDKNKDKYEEAIKKKEIHKILVCKTNLKLNEYVNRDINAVKNMIKIILSYISQNHKPKLFVYGTKICSDSLQVM